MHSYIRVFKYKNNGFSKECQVSLIN